MHNVGTVPTFKMHNVGTVRMFKMRNVGTPIFCYLFFELEFGLFGKNKDPSLHQFFYLSLLGPTSQPPPADRMVIFGGSYQGEYFTSSKMKRTSRKKMN